MNLFIKANQANHIIVSISGGKDSSILMLFAESLKKEMPNTVFHYVHAVIDIDWNETKQIVIDQCDYFKVKPIFVQAIDKKGNKKGFLDQLTAPRKNRKTGEIGEYMFPDKTNARWCTSTLKTGPIDKYVRTLKGNVLDLIGERAEESNDRAKLIPWRPDNKNTRKDETRTVVKYSPILKMTEKEVWHLIEKNSIPIHPCYSWGVKRASCAICIFSSNKDIKIAAEKAPNIVKKYLEAENKISHFFKYKKATKKKPEIKMSVKDILNEQGFDIKKL